MDKKSILGMMLLAMLFFVYIQINAPTEAELTEQQRLQDSIALVNNTEIVQNVEDSKVIENIEVVPDSIKQELDSLRNLQNASEFGIYANNLQGKEENFVLENDKIIVTFSNKGAKIKQVELKEYKKVHLGRSHEKITTPLLLLEDEKNEFNFSFNSNGKNIDTENLFFSADKTNDKISFKVPSENGEMLEISYQLREGQYMLDIAVNTPLEDKEVKIKWVNYLDRIEDNTSYEKMYSTIYYKVIDEDTEHCSCTAEDKEELKETNIKWVSHSNQFFNSTLIADSSFTNSVLEITPLEEDSVNMKLAISEVNFRLDAQGDYKMQMYVGPNEFDILRSYDVGLDYIIPFGTSIFGTINRWLIRPLFDFLVVIFGRIGLAIILMTLIVKLVLYPLTYKMLVSQSKMAALKPVLARLKEKNKDDSQAQQMETMKTYREYGVNPMGGCLPMALQMPIWFALYRFFPASITFRQTKFWWADDLSSYDVIAWLPIEIPFYGDHVSLFTILWAISLVAYTYYNSQHMDYSAQPAMKYMQYMMPFMFLFYFNNFASGLSAYLFFSNLFNLAQNIITKKYIINQDKLEAKLQHNKANPKKKKKGGFQARMEQALKEQQKIADQKKKK